MTGNLRCNLCGRVFAATPTPVLAVRAHYQDYHEPPSPEGFIPTIAQPPLDPNVVLPSRTDDPSPDMVPVTPSAPLESGGGQFGGGGASESFDSPAGGSE
jgi:hypothetical protein